MDRAARFTVLAGLPAFVVYSPQALCTFGPWMTLIVGIPAADGIVLASDSRLTGRGQTPFSMDENKKKLFGFGPYGIGLAGFEGMTEDILEYLSGNAAGLIAPADAQTSPLAEPPPRDVRRVASAVQRFLYAIFSYRFNGASPQTWPSSSLLLAGYSHNGAKEVYCLDSREGFKAYKWRCTGSPTARNYVRLADSLLGTHDRKSLEAAKLLGAMLITTTATIDMTVGGATQMAVVTADSYVDLPAAEIAEHEKRAAEAVTGFREAWRDALLNRFKD